jgi:DNA polymerase III alpha subunit
MIQLKIRTEYSFGETYAPIPRIIERLKELGVFYAAIVDCNTWGHVKWHQACRTAGIIPILGVEVIVSGTEDRETRMFFHALNADGLKEMYAFMTKSHRQMIVTRYGRKPRLYRCDVELMSENVIVFAGDITDGRWLKKINAHLDLSPASVELNYKKQKIAEEYGLKSFDVSDNAYAYPEDREVFDIISSGKLKPTDQHIVPVKQGNTSIRYIAYDLPKAKPVVLPFADPVINKHVWAGLDKKFKERKIDTSTPELYQKYVDRIKYELALIKEKGFSSYFLIIEDIVLNTKKYVQFNNAKQPAAGSLVCYLLGITQIDPMTSGLLLENFANAIRNKLMNIVLKVPEGKQDIIMDYIELTYRESARVGKRLFYTPFKALKTVCTALKIADKKSHLGKTLMIEYAFAKKCFFKTLSADTEKNIWTYKVFSNASKIEGHVFSQEKDPAGVAITSKNIMDCCSIDDNGIAQIDMDDAAKLGLIKIEISGS